MTPLAVFRALGPVDVRSVRRDPMLRWVLLFGPLFGLAFRFVVPLVADLISARSEFDLTHYYVLIMSFIAPIAPALVGTVVGFLLLDQRDDDSLTGMLVTPMRMGDYIAYRITVPMALSVLLTIVMFPLAGLTALTAGQVVAASIAAAPLAPIYALFIGAFASNKVMGFAIAKGLGVLFAPVVISWFVAPPGQVAFGCVPQFWALKTFWAADAGEPYWGWVAGGLVYQAMVLAVLLRRFDAVSRR